MQTDFWKKVEESFQAAQALPPDQRAQFLEQIADPKLRSELRSLLDLTPAANSFLEGSPISSVEERPYLLAAGRKLASFEILEPIGRGGMGEVYRARDLRLKREVALKVLAPEVTLAERRRFLHEAQAASALNHPNIVTIHEVGEQDGVSFIAMEFMAGKTLDALIPPQGMRLPGALDIAVQLAGALAAAHSAGIVHRDLKPRNVMVTESGVVKVLDFGLAKRTESTGQEQPNTEPGTILGTAGYMSPEQAEGKPLDARTDVFSFGVTLYELLTGTRAFERSSTASTIAAILTEEPPPLKHTPPELERIVQRCLRKDPSRRFQTMADVKAALSEAGDELRNGRHAHGWLRSRWLLAAAAASVLVIALAAWAYLSHATDSAPRLLPLTSYPGSVQSPGFSPDGRQIAFSWNGDKQDNFDIYVKYVDDPTAVRLTTSTEVDDCPAWSPDGRSLAFVRRTSAGGKLMLVPALGGPERILGNVNENSAIEWAHDGESMLISHRDSPAEPFALFLYRFTTGEKIRLTNPPRDSFGDYNPSLSPDQRSLVYWRRGSQRCCEGGIQRKPLELQVSSVTEGLQSAGNAQTIGTIPWHENVSKAIWTRDGSEVLYSALVSTAQSAILRTDARRPGKPELVAGTENGLTPALSPDGHRLAFVRSTGDSNIWRLELIDRRPAGAPEALLTSSAVEYNPQYSPDAPLVAFEATRGGAVEVWVSNGEGGNAVPVTNVSRMQQGTAGVQNFAGTPRWSPDGQRLAFDTNLLGKLDIYTVSRTGGPIQRITYGNANHAIPSYSRDGRWIYFASDSTGRNEIWKVPVAGGTAAQVTHKGGWVAMESWDGRWLFYTKATGRADEESPLWMMKVEGGAEMEIINSVHARAFDVSDDGIYFLTLPGGRPYPTLMFYRFADRKAQPLINLTNSVNQGLAASRDGRYGFMGSGGSQQERTDDDRWISVRRAGPRVQARDGGSWEGIDRNHRSQSWQLAIPESRDLFPERGAFHPLDFQA